MARKTKPVDIGTKAETDVVRWAMTHEFIAADRLTKKGIHDRGDVKITDEVMVQVKDGYTNGREPTDFQIGKWLGDLDDQKKEGGWQYTFLVHKRAGKANPDMWRWYADGHTFRRLVTGDEPVIGQWPPYVQLQGYMIPPLLHYRGIRR